MYAIAFDLKTNPTDNKEYDDVRQELEAHGFEWTQGSVYISRNSENSLAAVYEAIHALASIEWFRNSVRDIRAFKVEDWSNFTEIVRRGS